MNLGPLVSPWRYAADALAEWFDTQVAGGIFMTDTELRVQAWNRWLEVHTGREASAVIGQELFVLFPDLPARGIDHFYREALAGDARVVAQRFHGYLLPVTEHRSGPPAESGALMPQTARIAPVRADGRIVGTLTVIENVGERMMSERQLRNQIDALERAHETAEAALRAKDEFLATLSHELRTPLTAVLGWTRLLRTGELDPETLRRALEVIDRNATVQAQLIDDLLDVAHLMRGRMRVEMRPTDAAPAVLAAVEAIRPTAQAKDVTVSTVLAADETEVVGDARRLQQVVWNLLSNAVKFTDAGGLVAVRMEREAGRLLIVVSDTGKGIAPEFLPFVFDRFRQEDSRPTRRFGGLGLGLALVRQLVELHGGTVEARSPGDGMGATFVVGLPLHRAAA